MYNCTYIYIYIERGGHTKMCVCALHLGCRSTEYKCRNGYCISRLLLCDGVDNCGDGSDELTDYDVCGKLIASDCQSISINLYFTIIGFTTAFAVLHLITLTIKDGSLHGSDNLV